MWPNPQETADLVTFPQEILNWKPSLFVQWLLAILAIFHSTFLSWMNYEKLLIIEFQKMRDKVIVLGLRSVTVLKISHSMDAS